MGLYIKYLKPPESCDVCPVRLVFTTCGCDLDHCMFLEVPEPHGELIDMDDFLSEWSELESYRTAMRLCGVIPSSKEE